MTIEAMKQAIEALELFASPDVIGWEIAKNAYTTLKQAIEQAESQEPVAWIVPVHTHGGDISQKLSWTKSGAGISGVLFEPSERFPLYKSPPKREWVSLSKKEVQEIFDMDLGVYESIEETMRQLEEKNNG
jgi:hypothetical protein